MMRTWNEPKWIQCTKRHSGLYYISQTVSRTEEPLLVRLYQIKRNPQAGAGGAVKLTEPIPIPYAHALIYISARVEEIIDMKASSLTNEDCCEMKYLQALTRIFLSERKDWDKDWERDESAIVFFGSAVLNPYCIREERRPKGQSSQQTHSTHAREQFLLQFQNQDVYNLAPSAEFWTSKDLVRYEKKEELPVSCL
jgi:hypothetical protein